MQRDQIQHEALLHAQTISRNQKIILQNINVSTIKNGKPNTIIGDIKNLIDVNWLNLLLRNKIHVYNNKLDLLDEK